MARGPAWVLVVVVLVAGLLGIVPTPGADAAAPATASSTGADAPHHRRPLFERSGFADPSVVRWRRGYVGVATGPLAPRTRAGRSDGGWRKAGTALARRPRWASSRSVWAGDVVRVGPRWLLYFAAPVRGLGEGGRCIGVAAARRPTGRFHVVGDRPLVCPRGARTRPARDTVPDRVRATGPRRSPRGVIDAEAFRQGRHRFLLYRTQGTPSSIRLVRLTGNGLSTPHRGRSRELVRTPGVVENPSMVRHGRGYYLLTSEGYYGDCGYSTTWRRSTSLWRWRHSRPRVLLDRARTGLCGPGGADVVDTPGVRSGRPERAMVVLHGWSCPRHGSARGRGTACPDTGVDYQRSRRWGARRSLYAAWLWWDRGRPRVTSFVVPTRARPTPPVVPETVLAPEVVPEVAPEVGPMALGPLVGPGLVRLTGPLVGPGLWDRPVVPGG